MKQLLFLVIFVFLIASCNSEKSRDAKFNSVSSDRMEMMSVANASPAATPPQVEQLKTKEVDKKKIIKDGRLGLKVTDLEKTKSKIDALVSSLSGYYANESLNNSDFESSYQLKIRIPSGNLEKFILEIESGDGQIQYKEIDARDVTEEFIDLETRLENKKNYLKRYIELLKQAKNVKDILEIQEKTRVIEEEIESSEGRLKYLNDLVAFSTLDLRITKERDFKFSPETRDKFSERFKQSLSNGWYGFIDFLLFLIKLWPFWVLITMAIWFWKRIKLNRKKK